MPNVHRTSMRLLASQQPHATENVWDDFNLIDKAKGAAYGCGPASLCARCR
jgi:hypothetical protein